MFCNKDCHNCIDEYICYRSLTLFDDLEKINAVSEVALLETSPVSVEEKVT